MQRAIDYAGYVMANIIAVWGLFYVLLFAHVYLNGQIIPQSIRYDGDQISSDLTLWYVLSLLILSLELSGLLYLLYQFNRWYSKPAKSQVKLPEPTIITGLVGIIVGIAILFFLLG